jgi:DNA polymerase III subunit delta
MSPQSCQVTLIYGSEPLLRREAVQRLRDASVSPDARIWDESILTAGEQDLSLVLNALKTQSIQAKGRFVWVRDSEKLRSAEVKELEDDRNHWAPQNQLLLEASTLKAKHPLLQFAKDAGKFIPCEPLKGGALVQWVRDRLRKEKISVPGRTPVLMVERIGNKMLDLEQVVEKIALFSKGKSQVDEKDISDLIGPDQAEVLFELTDAVGKKDTASALRFVDRMLRQGRQIPEIIGLIFWQLKQLLTTLDFLEKARATQAKEPGHLTQVFAKALKRHPYYAEKLIEKARRFKRSELDRDLDFILEADLKTKSTGLKDRIVLESLVLKLTQTTS